MVQPDGYRYGQVWDMKAKPRTGYLARYDAAGRAVPFPAAGAAKWFPLSGLTPTGWGADFELTMTPGKELLIRYNRALPPDKGDYNPKKQWNGPTDGLDKLAADGRLVRDYIYGV